MISDNKVPLIYNENIEKKFLDYGADKFIYNEALPAKNIRQASNSCRLKVGDALCGLFYAELYGEPLHAPELLFDKGKILERSSNAILPKVGNVMNKIALGIQEFLLSPYFDEYDFAKSGRADVRRLGIRSNSSHKEIVISTYQLDSPEIYVRGTYAYSFNLNLTSKVQVQVASLNFSQTDILNIPHQFVEVFK